MLERLGWQGVFSSRLLQLSAPPPMLPLPRQQELFLPFASDEVCCCVETFLCLASV